jgi:hypothetical protein
MASAFQVKQAANAVKASVPKLLGLSRYCRLPLAGLIGHRLAATSETYNTVGPRVFSVRRHPIHKLSKLASQAQST